MQSDRNFLLTDDEGNNIAVISKKGKATPKEFNDAIGLAIKEHFVVDSVVVNRVEDELKLTAFSLEGNEEEIRDFTLEEIVVY